MTKKKLVITLLVAVVIGTTLLTGCGETTETITSTQLETEARTEAQTVAGSYALFQTQDVQEYLSFLETFDETKYEIVDISTSIRGFNGYGSTEFYMVTYKTIEE